MLVGRTKRDDDKEGDSLEWDSGEEDNMMKKMDQGNYLQQAKTKETTKKQQRSNKETINA